MELTLVKSSNIQAVGYLQVDRVILVRYRDGALYARVDASPDQFVSLMAAESKGAFVAAMPNPAARLVSGKERAVDSQSKATASAALACSGTPPDDTVTNVLDLEAGKCCQKALVGHWPKSPEAYCPDCGSLFAAEVVGPTRYWRFRPVVAIVRPR